MTYAEMVAQAEEASRLYEASVGQPAKRRQMLRMTANHLWALVLQAQSPEENDDESV